VLNDYYTIGGKQYYLRDVDRKKKIYKEETGKIYDERSFSTAFREESLKFKNLSLNYPPYFATNSDVLYLSGVSNSTTMICNENGYFSFIESDRYGFNNPDKEWNNEEFEFILIGDSITFGQCVNRPNDIASVLRKLSNKPVLSLGYPGNGPLTEYAILREYLPKKVKNIIWIFHDNDFGDLSSEKNKKKLAEYLTNKKDFSNNLKEKQNKIDIFLKTKKNSILTNSEIQASYWNNYYSFKKKTLRFFRLDKFKKFVNNIFYTNNSDNITINNKLNDFREISMLFKELAAKNNSNLYFVYIGDHEHYKSYINRKFDISYINSPAREIVKIIRDLNIPIIDTHNDFFKKESDLLAYFPFRSRGHYNVLGYKKITEFIFSKINY
tara:strand:- start:129 stop:1274 length:1146 start_codon:yes stop_codon:yes gene_type:complete